MYYAGLRVSERDSEAYARIKRRTVDDLIRLRSALKANNSDTSRGPGVDQQKLRIATWNLREFDTPTYGFRLKEAYYYIAEVISAFDLMALQEIRGDTSALKRVLKILGPDWDVIMSDSEESSAAHNERMVFVFNKKRVRFSGTAGEVTLSGNDRLSLLDSFDMNFPDGIEIELPEGEELIQPEKIPSDKVSDGVYNIKPAALVELPAGTKVVLPEGAQLAFKGRPTEFSHEVVNGRISNKRLDLYRQVV